MSTNLGAQQLTGGMANPETAVNTATGRLDAAITEIMVVDLTNDVTLTTIQYQSAFRFDVTPSGTAKTLTLPAVKRMCFINNTSVHDITVKCGTTTQLLAAGRMGQFYTDGTANGLIRMLMRGSNVHFFTAAGTPGTVAGAVDGDFYVNSTNGALYQLGLNTAGTWDSTGVTLGGGGGGGGSVPHWYSGAGAPGTIAGSVDGDMYYNTTSGALYQKGLVTTGVWTADGVTLSAGGGGGGGSGLYSPAMTAVPTAASTGFSNWFNQGSSTVSDTAAGILLDCPLAAGDNHVGRYKTAPAAPYKVDALFGITRNGNNFNSIGLGWYDGTNKIHAIHNVLGSGLKPYIEVDRWSTPTSFNGNDFTGKECNIETTMSWFQIEDDGTTVYFRISGDGVNFMTLFSVAKASGYLGATGYSNICFVNSARSFRQMVTLMSYKEH